MATEIFAQPELMDLEVPANSAEWTAICESLGLTSQLDLSAKSPTSQAPPYQAVDERTSKIIRALCPDKTKYKEYRASAIPLDVLQEIAKCEKHGWYEDIYIYSDDKTPDPFVLGYFKANYGTYHLIARWGAELLPWEMLEQKAIVRIKAIALPRLNEMKARIEYAIKNADKFIDGLLSNESVPQLDIPIRHVANY